MERKLVSRLRSDVDLTSIIGNAIYAYRAPEDASNPLVIWQTISSQNDRNISGRNGIASSRVQFSCYADTLAQSRQIADAIFASLDSFVGDINGMHFISIWESNRNDQFINNDNSYVVYADYQVNYMR